MKINITCKMVIFVIVAFKKTLSSFKQAFNKERCVGQEVSGHSVNLLPFSSVCSEVLNTGRCSLS